MKDSFEEDFEEEDFEGDRSSHGSDDEQEEEARLGGNRDVRSADGLGGLEAGGNKDGMGDMRDVGGVEEAVAQPSFAARMLADRKNPDRKINDFGDRDVEVEESTSSAHLQLEAGSKSDEEYDEEYDEEEYEDEDEYSEDHVSEAMPDENGSLGGDAADADRDSADGEGENELEVDSQRSMLVLEQRATPALEAARDGVGSSVVEAATANPYNIYHVVGVDDRPDAHTTDDAAQTADDAAQNADDAALDSAFASFLGSGAAEGHEAAATTPPAPPNELISSAEFDGGTTRSAEGKPRARSRKDEAEAERAVAGNLEGPVVGAAATAVLGDDDEGWEDDIMCFISSLSPTAVLPDITIGEDDRPLTPLPPISIGSPVLQASPRQQAADRLQAGLKGHLARRTYKKQEAAATAIASGDHLTLPD